MLKKLLFKTNFSQIIDSAFSCPNEVKLECYVQRKLE